jgi:hypothetical protein
MDKEEIQKQINEIESKYPNLHIDLHRDKFESGDVDKLHSLYNLLNKFKKYNYTYEEYSQDTRSYEIASDVMLTEEEIQDIALGCSLTDGYTYEGGGAGKRFKATFKGTEFGDDSQTEYGGDKIKQTDEDGEEE